MQSQLLLCALLFLGTFESNHCLLHSIKHSLGRILFASRHGRQRQGQRDISSNKAQFFLDSADVHEWDRFMKLGIFHGITTNPVLLERAKVKCEIEPTLHDLAHKAFNEYGAKVFMIQTFGNSVDEYVRNGLKIAAIDVEEKRIVVKVPLTEMGIIAAKQLIEKGVRVCMTTCYCQHQVFTSCGLGAEYVAPYLGRMTDSGMDGMTEVLNMHRIAMGLNAKTRVFVASLRDTNQLPALASQGLNTFTFSPKIAEGLLHSPNNLTMKATNDFETAAINAGR